MRLRCLCALLLLLAAGPAASAAPVIEDFEKGVAGWQPEMAYGKVDGCKASPGEGKGGGGALRLDYDFGAEGTNHLIYARRGEWDLSWAEGISFSVKGAGMPVMLFLFLFDSKDRHTVYGPHGSNGDFTTGYADWHTCRLSFDLDRPVSAASADLSDIRRIGFMLNKDGVRKGSVWLDDLAAVETAGTATVTPDAFSPNGDGVCDTAEVVAHARRDSKLTVEVLNAGGAAVATLARDMQPERRRVVLAWDGRAQGKTLPDGTYRVRVRFAGTEAGEVLQPVTLSTKHRWPPVKYQNKPFFPIGVWFEGAPKMNGAPSHPKGARKYYDRAFADLAAHGFNAAAVPNCPESLWEPLLASAQAHGIRIALEVGPLVALVSKPEPVTEEEAYAAVKRVVDKIGKYPSLMRYQIRDEPPTDMVGNWILVQRVLAALDPKRPAFSCCCHPESLQRLAEKTILSEGVFDVYPQRQGMPLQTLGSFLPSFDIFKTAAKGNTLWAVLQAFGVGHEKGSWRYPTPEELRAVTYLSLAEGSKGVFFFIYSHMPGYLDGMVSAAGEEQPIYRPTYELARELGRLSPLLLALKPAATPARVEGDARAGSYLDAKGRPVLIVASARPDKAAPIRVTGVPAGTWKDALTGEVVPATAAGLSLTLAPGAGRVLSRQ